jgi:hypothetical protein
MSRGLHVRTSTVTPVGWRSRRAGVYFVFTWVGALLCPAPSRHAERADLLSCAIRPGTSFFMQYRVNHPGESP